jgi:hypothetical protein
MKQVGQIIGQLQGFRFEPGYIDRLEAVVDELRECDDAQLAIGPLLRFIEEHPSEDLGAPGPLVHFVEEFHRRGYEEQLLESVARRPTELNVWMLNRLVNGSEGAEKQRYLDLLRRVAKDERTDPTVRGVAEEFLSYQQV